MTSRRPLVIIDGLVQEIPLGDDVTGVSNDAEFVRDTIAAALIGSAGITVTPNDDGNTITITCTINAEFIRDTIGTALRQGEGTILSVNDTNDTITYSVDPEFIRDVIGNALSATQGVSIDIDDENNAIILRGDPEYIRDTIGTALVSGTGVVISVNDEDNTITISADGSTSIPFIYAPAVYYPGTLKAAAVTMLRHTFVQPCALPPNCAGSAGGAEDVATTTTVYRIQRSRAATPETFTDIGTASYALGSRVPTFSTSGLDFDFAAGDTLRVVGPDLPDLTLSHTNFTLLFYRTA